MELVVKNIHSLRPNPPGIVDQPQCQAFIERDGGPHCMAAKLFVNVAPKCHGRGKKIYCKLSKATQASLRPKLLPANLKTFTSDATKEMPWHGNGTSLYHPLTVKAIKSTTAKESLYKENKMLTVYDYVKLRFVQNCCISYTCNCNIFKQQHILIGP